MLIFWPYHAQIHQPRNHQISQQQKKLKTATALTFGHKLINRIEHAKENATKDELILFEKLKFKVNENDEINKNELLEGNHQCIYLAFENRLKKVKWQDSQEGIKIKTTSQEIIDFVKNQRSQKESKSSAKNARGRLSANANEDDDDENG